MHIKLNVESLLYDFDMIDHDQLTSVLDSSHPVNGYFVDSFIHGPN